MNYERQEQAFDPIANREREDERADMIAFNEYTDEWWTTPKHKYEPDIDRIQAERDEAVGTAAFLISRLRHNLPPIGNHISIDYRWMEAPLNGREEVEDGDTRRDKWPVLAACDVDAHLWQNFYHMRPAKDSGFPVFGGARIHINRITMSKGWSK